MLSSTLWGIRKAFPSVQHVSTEILDEWIKKEPNSVQILDVRETPEFEVFIFEFSTYSATPHQLST